jgi:hypothetical protein
LISGYLPAAEGGSMRRGLILLALLATAQSGPATLNQARQAFSGCLATLLRDSLRQRVPADEFEDKLAASCTAAEQAFRAASIATDLAAGSSRAAAEQGASFEVVDMRDNTLGRYKDYLETNTAPR